MSLSANDYINLYKLQDKAFHALFNHYGAFYLTGGTALGRFYLNHRYSDDIDLFVNADSSFNASATAIRNVIDKQFTMGHGNPVLYADFIRIWIKEDNHELKIELVNDVASHWGDIHHVNNIPVDNPGNILANKLTAIVGRDEPKDIFDIIHLSLNYSFNWAAVFEQSTRKAVVAEQNVSDRLAAFPVEWLQNKLWLKSPIDADDLKQKLEIIADDFLFARDNSFGKGKIPITEAKPNVY